MNAWLFLVAALPTPQQAEQPRPEWTHPTGFYDVQGYVPLSFLAPESAVADSVRLSTEERLAALRKRPGDPVLLALCLSDARADLKPERVVDVTSVARRQYHWNDAPPDVEVAYQSACAAYRLTKMSEIPRDDLRGFYDWGSAPETEPLMHCSRAVMLTYMSYFSLTWSQGRFREICQARLAREPDFHTLRLLYAQNFMLGTTLRVIGGEEVPVPASERSNPQRAADEAVVAVVGLGDRLPVSYFVAGTLNERSRPSQALLWLKRYVTFKSEPEARRKKAQARIDRLEGR